LPAVLYGCETWSDTLRDQRRLRVLEKGVLRKIIFGFKMEELIGECRTRSSVIYKTSTSA